MASRDPDYRPRSADEVRARANQKTGMYDSYIRDDVKIWECKEGDHFIRILRPTWKNAKHYGLDILVHYGVGPDSESYICNRYVAKLSKQFGIEFPDFPGEECAICDERERAGRGGDEDYAAVLKPTRRVIVYILDLDNRNKPMPIIWAMPQSVDKEIAMRAFNKRTNETLNIDDSEYGHDIEFTRKGTGKNNTEYLGVSVDPKETPIAKDDDDFYDILDYIKNNPIPTIFQFFPYEYVQAKVSGTAAAKDRGSKRGQESERTERRSRFSQEEEDPKESRRSDRRDSREDSRRSDRGEKEERGSRRGRDDDDDRSGGRGDRGEREDRGSSRQGRDRNQDDVERADDEGGGRTRRRMSDDDERRTERPSDEELDDRVSRFQDRLR